MMMIAYTEIILMACDRHDKLEHSAAQMFKRGSALLVALWGLLGGIGAYTFHYAEGFSYFSTDPRACVNCHIMNPQYDSWQNSSHHTVASCVDCHEDMTDVMLSYSENLRMSCWSARIAFRIPTTRCYSELARRWTLCSTRLPPPRPLARAASILARRWTISARPNGGWTTSSPKIRWAFTPRRRPPASWPSQSTSPAADRWPPSNRASEPAFGTIWSSNIEYIPVQNYLQSHYRKHFNLGVYGYHFQKALKNAALQLDENSLLG
jgi:hypothetical protein